MESPRKRRRLNPAETGAYVLKPVIENVPLTTEGQAENVHITCVEFWSTKRREAAYDSVR